MSTTAKKYSVVTPPALPDPVAITVDCWINTTTMKISLKKPITTIGYKYFPANTPIPVNMWNSNNVVDFIKLN